MSVRVKIGAISLLILVLLIAALPWASGQVIAYKVKRQLTALDTHPALSIVEQSWQSGYGQSSGKVVLLERVGCGLRACNQLVLSVDATHPNWQQLGWGTVRVQTDLNKVLSHPLSPPLADFSVSSDVGLLGHSSLHVQIPASWHRLSSKRADALAFSGMDEAFTAKDYARYWTGKVSASFTVISEGGTPQQRDRISRAMHSLGPVMQPSSEPMGAVVVRILALMRELDTAIALWQDQIDTGSLLPTSAAEVMAQQPQTEADSPVLAENQGMVELVTNNTNDEDPSSTPLNLELVGALVAPQTEQRRIALNLPRFESWHGDSPQPAVLSRLTPEGYEVEKPIDIWQLQLGWSGGTMSLNGIAIWQAK